MSANKSLSHKRLASLRDELSKVEIPPYPNNPYLHIKQWIAKAIPIIRTDWPNVFDDFNSQVTINDWNNLGFATYAGFLPGSYDHQQAWAKDVKEAQELCQKVLQFIDGLLDLPTSRQRNSSKTDQSIHIHLGEKASVGNLVVSSSITNSFNKINSSDIPDELKKALQDLTDAINLMIAELPDEEARQANHDIETLIAEVTSKSPRPQWYQLSIDGLKKAAKDVGEIGLPVLKCAAAVLTLLLMKP